MEPKQAAIYHVMKAGEGRQVCDLVVSVFSEFVAPLYSPEGVREFLTCAADPDQLRERLRKNHFVLVAELRGRIVGAIEVRNCDHISLFFVDGRSQRAGTGEGLWRQALHNCLTKLPPVTRITVHSSLNAAGACERLGFQATGP